MPCFYPHRAWRTRGGEVILGKEPPDSESLRLPCGGCIGCNESRAKAWALRCHLEAQRHEHAVFTNLTYRDEMLPPTLERRALQLWIKRLRKKMGPNRPLRFFASGEYGEQTHRPHYHAILYGASLQDAELIEESWGKGHCRTSQLTPDRISYCAGYAAKKIGWRLKAAEERVDPMTGEVYTWQPPFVQMSRRPGIGGEARKWRNSWKEFAVHNGFPMPVPRFLHAAWKDTATEEEIEDLRIKKRELALRRDTSEYSIRAAELIKIREKALRADRRNQL